MILTLLLACTGTIDLADTAGDTGTVVEQYDYSGLPLGYEPSPLPTDIVGGTWMPRPCDQNDGELWILTKSDPALGIFIGYHKYGDGLWRIMKSDAIHADPMLHYIIAWNADVFECRAWEWIAL